jgi:hypothetical protein
MCYGLNTRKLFVALMNNFAMPRHWKNRKYEVFFEIYKISTISNYP